MTQQPNDTPQKETFTIEDAERLLETAKKEREAWEKKNGKTKESKEFAELEKVFRGEIKRIKQNNNWTYGGQIHRIYDLMQQKNLNSGVVIEQKELNLSAFPTWIYQLLSFILAPFLRETAGWAQSHNELKLDRFAMLHVIPARGLYTHSVCIIVDNVNKKVLFYDPNGLANKRITDLKNVKNKQELLEACFSKEDAKFLMDNQYETIDVNSWKSEPTHGCDKTIAGGLLNENNSCAISTASFIENFIRKYRKIYEERDMFHLNNGEVSAKFLEYCNYNKINTEKMDEKQAKKIFTEFLNNIPNKYKKKIDDYEKFLKYHVIEPFFKSVSADTLKAQKAHYMLDIMDNHSFSGKIQSKKSLTNLNSITKKLGVNPD